MTSDSAWHGRVLAAGAPVAGVRVSDGARVVVTAPDGGYRLPLDPETRFLMVTTPRGHRADAWYVATAGRDPAAPVDFALESAPERDGSDFTLVQVTDIHVSVDHDDSGPRLGDSLYVKKTSTGERGDTPLTRWDDLAAELQHIAATEGDAIAYVITGDLANRGRRAEHEAFARALEAAPLPGHCIPGNHDYMDEQARERNYEAVLGPRYYSFDIGGIHFAALDWWELDQFPARAARQAAWLEQDLAAQPPSTPIVLLTHDQLPEALLAPYRAHHLLATFSGHKHATRTYDDGKTLHFNTPTLMFGAYDHSPRCYRVLRFSGDRVTVETKSLHAGPDLTRQCFSASRPAGVERTGDAPAISLNGDWSQFHGGSARAGVAAGEIAPPLSVAWTAHLGAPLNLGGPVVAGDAVIIGTQGEDAPGGALVALDATTGQERWRVPMANAIKRTPAVADGVAVACTVTGELVAVDVATGAVRWRYQLGDPSCCWIYTAPVIADGVVCLGEAFHFAAVDLQSGEPRWIRDDFGHLAEFVNMSSPAALDDRLFVSFFWQQHNYAALDVRTGETLWRHSEGTRRGAMCGAAAGYGKVYVTRVTMNLECLDATTGDLHWRTRLGAIFNQATPCVTEEVVYAVSGLGSVQALDADTGESRWSWQAEEALLDTAPYMRGCPSTVASPVLAGRYLYVPSNCGRLTALDAQTGQPVWSHDFGVPLPGAPAASGNALFLPAADGSVTALVSA